MKAPGPIHLFVPVFRVEECLAEIRKCLERGWTGLGYKTIEFEDAWKKFTGLPHAHFVSSCTAGLHLAVRLLKEKYGWRDGDEVITTPLTFVSTNHVILYERLKPVFCDVDEHLCLDPSSVEASITERTRAVMFVGLGGSTGRFEEVVSICRSRSLPLILDAAHMSGTRLHGRHAGHGADVSVFSFHAVKNLPTADSGMVCFSDEGLDREVRKWTWLGISKDTYTRMSETGDYRWLYDVHHKGFKYHGNSVMAALGLVALKYLDEDNAYRRRLSSWYDELLPGTPPVKAVPIPDDCELSRHLYQVTAERRDELMTHLNSMQIYPGVHYQDNTLYRMYRGGPVQPRARGASQRLMSLPLHLRMDRDDIRRVCEAIRAFYG